MTEKSPITGKIYDSAQAIYITNIMQAQRYLDVLGPEYLYDILWSSTKKKGAIVFVFAKCKETANAKDLWDKHEL